MTGALAHDPDRATEVADPAWLAAYALGLAYSATSREQRIDRLRDAVDGSCERLVAARQRLDATRVAEPHVRDQAQRLLDLAATTDGHDRHAGSRR